MSYTVVIDEQERDRRLANESNKMFRHCRIGKVRPKTPEWMVRLITAPRPKKDTFFIDPLGQIATWQQTPLA